MRLLSILIYHRVLRQLDPLLPGVPDQRQFARQMSMLKRCFQVLPLSQAIDLLKNDALPRRAACITFDDGYADNFEIALPVLQSLGLNACFFIASGYLDGGRMWNDDVIAGVRSSAGTAAERVAAIETKLGQIKYLPARQRSAIAQQLAPDPSEDLMMTSAQLRILHRSGMEIGAHTVSHPILRIQPDHLALQDIAQSKLALEAIVDAPVTLFAYPNGKPGIDYDLRHVEMARRCGFSGAVTTVAAAASAASDCFQLPRFTPWEPDRSRFILRLLQNRYHSRA